MTACFLVRCSSDLGKESGKTWAPGKCKFFMWLVAHNRCWTADCLARSLEEAFLIMSIASCVTRKRKPSITCWWLAFLHSKFGTVCYIWSVCNLCPQPDETSFAEWWANSVERVSGQDKGIRLSS